MTREQHCYCWCYANNHGGFRWRHNHTQQTCHVCAHRNQPKEQHSGGVVDTESWLRPWILYHNLGFKSWSAWWLRLHGLWGGLCRPDIDLLHWELNSAWTHCGCSKLSKREAVTELFYWITFGRGFGFCGGEKWKRAKRSHFWVEWNATYKMHDSRCYEWMAWFKLWSNLWAWLENLWCWMWLPLIAAICHLPFGELSRTKLTLVEAYTDPIITLNPLTKYVFFYPIILIFEN